MTECSLGAEAGRCDKCGSGVLVRSYIAEICPICGKYFFPTCADDTAVRAASNPAAAAAEWNEHRLGLMMKKDGWRWIEVLSPPRWFTEEVA